LIADLIAAHPEALGGYGHAIFAHQHYRNPAIAWTEGSLPHAKQSARPQGLQFDGVDLQVVLGIDGFINYAAQQHTVAQRFGHDGIEGKLSPHTDHFWQF
jgi:hypothetical protein